MNAQLDAFGWNDDQWTTAMPCRDGAAAYVHLIRGPLDPERSSRKERHARHGGMLHSAVAWREMLTWDVEAVAQVILEHLADGEPRTFNRMCVELWDRTADVCFGAGVPDEALWLLLERGSLERTSWAPIHWRIAR